MTKACGVDRAKARIAERAITPVPAVSGSSPAHDAPHSDHSPELSAADELWLLEASEHSIVAITEVLGSNGAKRITRTRRKAADDSGGNCYVCLTVRGTLSQMLSKGETVRVFDGVIELGSAKVRDRAWIFQDARSLCGGEVVSYAARVADAAGNLCPAASIYMMTVEPVDTQRHGDSP